MKFETLAKRLAEKAEAPKLEPLLLGEIEVKDLPMTCMPWQGAIMGQRAEPRRKMYRDPNYGLRVNLDAGRAYPVIRYEKRTWAVVRLIVSKISTVPRHFRLENQCGDTTCVNPLHWLVHEVTPATPEPPEEEELILDDDDWTDDDIEELLNMALEAREFGGFEEVIADPLLEGAPREQVRETLIRMNKAHLA